jgi:hypothetical protein
VVVGLLHPDGPANNHRVVFAVYAGSASWTAVHLGQFAGMAVIIAGLLVLYFVLDVRVGGAAWVARLGAVAAAVALGLYCVLQAVDGVALKQAVDAWVDAPEAEKAARFAGAETIRWLEWGTRSYQSFMFGLALILLGGAVAVTARLPRALGYLMGLSGLAYLVQGWVLGSEGFPEPTRSRSSPAIFSSWRGSSGLLWSPGGQRNRPERLLDSNRPVALVSCDSGCLTPL